MSLLPRFSLLVLLLGGCTVWPCLAQLIEATPHAFVDVAHGSVAWGDYDGDGDLDLLLTGLMASRKAVTRVYENRGAAGFAEHDPGFESISMGAAAWGDYDGDGDLDVALNGWANTGHLVGRIYTQDATGQFAPNPSALEGLWGTDVAWSDYDGDGDLDLTMAGQNAYRQPVTRVYANDGHGLFEQAESAFAGAVFGTLAWGDYDNDDRSDVLVTGSGQEGYRSLVYHNNGDGRYQENPAGRHVLANVLMSAAAWGDYDGDGDLDLILTGYGSAGPLSQLYKNDGMGGFEADTAVTLPGVHYGAVAWADHDGDGDLDLLLSGCQTKYCDLGSRLTRLYDNDGAGRFAENPVARSVLPGVAYSALAWGDYDGDGDLDLLLTGWDNEDRILTRLYQNACACAQAVGTSATPDLPEGYQLDQNYPNPFNPVTTITFTLPVATSVRLAVYDLMGREVALLQEGMAAAGHHAVPYSAQGLPGGVYLYRLQTARHSQQKAMVLLK